jgi:mono/diheme cytochrome c family protein
MSASGRTPWASAFGVRTGRRPRGAAIVPVLGCVAAILLLTGCRQDMHDQPKFKPFAKSDFYDDQRSARPAVEGTIARGQLRADELFETGKVGGQPSAQFPFVVTASVLERGRDRYNIFCSPCHGRMGQGDGMIVRRGFRRPPSFHQDRLVQAPAGYLFDVTTRGFGLMPDYATQVPAADRWAIIAYVRVLQRSQRATVADVPGADRGALDAAGTPQAAPAPEKK